MNWLRTTLTIIQLGAALAIIGLVLLQRGKGADAGAGFGAGASGTVFGARGATTALSRATAVFAAIFMVNSLVLAYLGAHQSAEPQRTLLDEAADAKSKLPAVTVPSTPAPTGAPQTAPPAAPAPTPEPAK
ncbi:MAG: preprotein translocase subunit SecG [Proteobacteria bacterium]|nr:preprotein translocase subunit SecG [Pseudomonadota bacterium]